MPKKITIEKLAEMSQREFTAIQHQLDGMVTKELFSEGLTMVLFEIRGLRDDFNNFRGGVRIEHADFDQRITKLERERHHTPSNT